MASSNDTYTALGTEGTSLTRSVLIGKTILLCIQGNWPLQQVSSGATVGQYSFNSSTGVLTFGEALELNQVIQTIYK